MKTAQKIGIALALAAACTVALAQAGIVRGQTARGESFLVGGVGADEVSALQGAHSGYGLSVRTAARGSGAYLADVHLRIADAQGDPVFDRNLSGPWLLIALKPGRYTLQASRGADTQTATVTVAAGATHDQMFYFDVDGVPADPVRFPPATR